MRRVVFVLALLMLVGCGGGSSVGTPTIPVTPRQSASPTANAAGTATRGAEMAQIATLTAPTATVIATPMIAATPTALTPASTPVPATDTPSPLPTAATTPSPTFITVPTTTGGEVVTVLDDGTGQSVNVRTLPSVSANIVLQVRPGTTLPLKSTTPVSGDGGNWWQIMSDHGGAAYVRADLVSAPHMPSSVSQPIASITRTPKQATDAAGASAILLTATVLARAVRPPQATATPVTVVGKTLAIDLYYAIDDAPPGRNEQNRPGYRFVAYDIAIENLSGRSEHYSVYSISVKTADNRKYDPVTTLSQFSPKLSSGYVSGGETDRGWVVFEVPAGARIDTLNYDDYTQHISFAAKYP